MDKPIQVGDLVVVVRPTLCCGMTTVVGKIFRVVGFASTHHCSHCDEQATGLYAMWDGRWRTDIRRLKRIPPLEELDDVKRDEEITA